MFIVKSEGGIMMKKSLRQLIRWKIFIFRCGNCGEKLKSIASLADQGEKKKGGKTGMLGKVTTI